MIKNGKYYSNKPDNKWEKIFFRIGLTLFIILLIVLITLDYFSKL